ncbi:c-type cytochrome [Occallatibacter riparius]|uniref:Cytochrome c n=1 Tax=Occallatibacter riparius TaxID=1002689 RepID=A0A9J7BP81_9BACT|nr:cytochrome c [Occallatibacter riparius]UWZ84555.1 cytochrome c [Occallatibacter riparius]
MSKKLAIGLVVLSLSLVSTSAWAKDPAAVYKSKCAGCHGPAGEGKMGPALKGTSMSADDIASLLAKGDPAKKAPHNKHFSGATAEKAKALADYIKTL